MPAEPATGNRADAERDDAPPTVVCPNCARDVQNGSIYCPHCCGKKDRIGAIQRSGFVGGAVGLALGVVASAVWTTLAGPERATWGIVFGVTTACATTGAVLALARHLKE